MMRIVLLSLLLCCSVAYGQDISQEEAVQIACETGFFKTGKGWTEPGGDLDVKNGHWLMVSQRSTHSDRGKCRKTNGCTVLWTREMVIDAQTGKILSKNRSKDTFPNYE